MCISLGENLMEAFTNVVYVGELHLRQAGASVISALVDDHRQHLAHSVAADQFDADVTVGMVEADPDYTYTVVLACTQRVRPF